MGWWRNDAGDLVGDDPADHIQHDLKDLAAALGPPSLGTLLSNLQEVVRRKTHDLCGAEEDRAFDELVADVELGSDETIIVHPSGAVGAAIRDRLDTLCEKVSDSYAMALERRPTRRELLSSFAFVLGYAPDRFLDISEDSSVRDLRTTGAR